ncbi:hypothetical protein [Bathymodiolus thermophilus thioautotrophic gill symbiont]|jgi:hypothetical protein|uniref:Uncharacterized protein n=1 Tax=Bathymodiolus thermophilus thioautotrophic gill symbiont TaxID=2360 RepID=A0A8H8XAV3_9GAMM|nr:hypothetical protein [Bathymodiolus thermophilus thioautotrophic gill symbiont]CAB5495736.1 hypothetical protein THERMOS_354 [Bathymodiolus thermophilus thioautotrophic gill symbiont]
MLKIEKAPSANLRIINIESLDISLKEINKLSVTHKFKAPSLQSVKDRLESGVWQNVANLKAVCCQIVRTVTTENVALWN